MHLHRTKLGKSAPRPKTPKKAQAADRDKKREPHFKKAKSMEPLRHQTAGLAEHLVVGILSLSTIAIEWAVTEVDRSTC